MVSRRDFLKLSGACCAAGAGIGLPQISFANPLPQDATDVEVYVIFQAGGNDTLHNFIPYTDPLYRTLRPSLAFENPGDDNAHSALALGMSEGLNNSASLQLGLNPGMDKYKLLHDAGLVKTYLATTHMMGETTGSHFRAKDLASWGINRPNAGDDGWLNRLLQQSHSSQVVRGYAITSTLNPEIILQGEVVTANLRPPAPVNLAALAQRLNAMYASLGTGELMETLQLGLDSQASIASLDNSHPTLDLADLNSNFGVQTQVAALMNAQVKYLTHGGYDFHRNMNRGIEPNQPSLARHLREFWDAIYEMVQTLMALGKLDRSVIFIMSEFGRRVHEGSLRGVDHGFGGHLTVLGSPSRLRNLGMVYSDWAGMHQDAGGNLPGIMDSRQLMAQDLWDMMGDHLTRAQISQIFPDIDVAALLTPSGN